LQGHENVEKRTELMVKTERGQDVASRGQAYSSVDRSERLGEKGSIFDDPFRAKVRRFAGKVSVVFRKGTVIGRIVRGLATQVYIVQPGDQKEKWNKASEEGTGHSNRSGVGPAKTSKVPIGQREKGIKVSLSPTAKLPR
jgi:hypothetical protein